MDDRIKLGVSSCLLGENVRHDGSHRRDVFVADILSRFVEYVPVCPEVECGLGIPREPMHLEGDVDHPRLITSRTGQDLTDRMETWARCRLDELAGEGLCGFIFKSGSPSSGMERVSVRNAKGMPVKKGAGIFARMLMERFPLLPVEEDGRLHDAPLRENFIERIFTLKRWRDTVATGKTARNLVDFHTDHKLLIMAHSPRDVSVLGALVAKASEIDADELFARYQTQLLTTLSLKPTVKKHCNVLQHAAGYFKGDLSRDEKQELGELIDAYHAEYVPLIVPVTILNHYVRKYDKPYLKRQYYLNPHPLELKLRNHV